MPSIVVSVVVAPAAAHVSAAIAGTAGRTQALVVLAVGLISVVTGGLAVRSAAGAPRRGRAIAAVMVGLTGMILSALHLASSTAIGTGSGRLGAIVAFVVGLIGVVLGWLALTRSRRTT